MRDLYNEIAPVQLLAPIDKVHANWNSLVVDLAGFETLAFVVNVATLTAADTSNYLTLKLQESDDTVSANFTDVDTPTGSTIPNTQSNAPAKVTAAGVYLLGYIGFKRYVRVVGTYTGTAISAGIIGVTAILGHALHEPALPQAPTAITAS